MKTNQLCLVCKNLCQGKHYTNCSVCRALVHPKCVRLGLNYGIQNFICMSCHQKPSTNQVPIAEKITEYTTSTNNSTGLGLPTQDDTNTLTHAPCYDIEKRNRKIAIANQNNVLIGPSETADLYLGLDDLNSFLNKKTSPLPLGKFWNLD